MYFQTQNKINLNNVDVYFSYSNALIKKWLFNNIPL